MEFCDILSNILKEEGFNQTQFAVKVGVKQSQVSEWLHGKSKPGYDNIKAIVSALGVSAERLLGLNPLA